MPSQNLAVSSYFEEDRAIEALSALAQSSRLAAFRNLLAAHPGTLPAGEIAKRCAVPHNTMSTHLGILNQAGLVTVEREGRAMNYRADLRSFRGLVKFLTGDCCNGRPELCGDIARLVPDNEMEDRITMPAFNVLFLCTHNSARSIIAESVLEKIGKDRFRAYSAGSAPAAEPLPEVIGRLKVLGHDVGRLRCKSWKEFTGPDAPRMNFVIALCDTASEQFCPELGESFVTAAWPLPDPAQFMGSDSERKALLNELYGMICRRIEIFINLPFPSLDKMALKARIDEIGDSARISS
jgi:ArsR family transcriptional regulator, arsenate/arsenite/antimonite-responsive transcriptional repressor / arsenate reductase (thioredoxin)